MRIILIFFGLFLGATYAYSQVSTNELSNYIRFKDSIVTINGSVLIFKGDSVLAAYQSGLGDAFKKRYIDTSSTFLIASATKPITASAVLLLSDRGKLSLDDPLKKYLPGLPPQWSKITIKQLLSHTSGIIEVQSVKNPAGSALSFASFTNSVRKMPLLFPPGSSFSYSNTNYLLLSYLVDKVSGYSFEQFVADNIFAPFQMKNTGFAKTIKEVTTKPYLNALKLKDIPAEELDNLLLLRGAGNVYSTARDMQKFLKGLPNLLKSATFKLMTTPVLEDYALGWHVNKQFGKTIIKHPGGIKGFISEIRYSIDDSVGVVILSNVMHNDLPARYLAFDIYRLINNEIVVKPDNHKFTGTYTLPQEWKQRFGSADINIENKGAFLQLVIQGPRQTVQLLYPISDTKFFFYGEGGVIVTFINNSLLIQSPSLGNISAVKK
jgi:CubicO group peptidase (beta-lactamase class C family)